jgi:hypothetical protein
MPSVLDAPELVDYVETHELTPHGLTIERPQPHRTRPGFWHTLAHKITHSLTPTPRKPHAPSCSMPRPFEAPADLFARQYPTLYLRALCGV